MKIIQYSMLRHRIGLCLLAVGGILFAGFGFTRVSPVQAQEAQIVFIEGTVPVSEGLTSVLIAAIERSGIGTLLAPDYFAVTDVVDKDGWLFVSVVGLSGITDMAQWNIIDNGIWFSSVLVQVMGDEYLDAAVYGTPEYEDLIRLTPDSVVSPQAKQFLTQPEVQQAAGEDFIMPYPGGYQVHYGYLGVHTGWSMNGVDLGSDGNTALGHTPNYLIAASSGAVTYRCSPSTSGYTTATIRVGEFLYAHLVDSTVSWQVGEYVSRGTYLGMLETGSFSELPCGYATQSDNWFHVHFGFVEDPLTLSGWTLNTSTMIWTDGSDTWPKSSWKLIGEVPDPPDLIIDSISFVPSNPNEGQSIVATVQVRNAGGAVVIPFTVDLYFDGPPTVCTELGDYSTVIPSIGAGEIIEVEFLVTGLTAGSHQVDGYVDTNCVVDESGDPTDEDNEYGPDTLEVGLPTELFVDGFESGDFSLWTRYNDGKGYLYPCAQAAINGDWGACVERGDNDKRKQLIDETPVDQTSFAARFSFDINGLSMGQGERFRFMQMKINTDRAAFIVLMYDSGSYYIQLNTKLDDLSKAKTAWYRLTNAPHTIEVDWQAASAPGANDGYALLYIDAALQEALTGLDNDTLFITSFRMGFTSRLDGKIISGIFHIDDVVTSTTGYIGIP